MLNRCWPIGEHRVDCVCQIAFGWLVALHADAVRGWLSRHLGLSLAIGLAGAAAAEAWYCLARWRGQAPFTASSVFAPIMVVWGSAVITALFGLGARWAAGRRPEPDQACLLRHMPPPKEGTDQPGPAS